MNICREKRTLYVTDLDGTLLDNNSRISERSVKILNGLVDRGVMFTSATARTPATVVWECESVGIYGWVGSDASDSGYSHDRRR